MMQTSSLAMQETCTPNTIDDFIVNVGWDIRSTHTTALGTTPDTTMLGQDMFFDIPYIASWSEIWKCKQQQVHQSNIIENKNWNIFDYRVGTKVVLIKYGIPRNAEDKTNICPCRITEVLSNGAVKIQRGTINERINIRRLSPFFEQGI